jgi:membrane protein DedA with SNARE-associated domain
MIQAVIEQFTYGGIFAVLFVAGLGVPIPEEIPIAAAAVLAQQGLVRWWIVLPVCLLGVLAGDLVLYWSGRHWGQRLLNWRVVRVVLAAGQRISPRVFARYSSTESAEWFGCAPRKSRG